jgi:uncharacterized phage protein (TIGR01671 family)
MRNLKFRAWNPKSREMVKVDEISFYKDGTYRINGEVGSNEWILMQLTGAEDYNGKKIYVGDILDFGNDGAYCVVWLDNEFGFGFSDGLLLAHADFCYSKIIGNVYQNPEIHYL